jgi:hypothetical protein
VRCHRLEVDFVGGGGGGEDVEAGGTAKRVRRTEEGTGKGVCREGGEGEEKEAVTVALSSMASQ